MSSVMPRYALFDHQRVAVRQVLDKLGRHPRRALLHMPTGSGKTRMAMTIVAEHLRSHEPTVACWLANSEELCEQAAEEFEESWSQLGNRTVSLAPFWGPSQTDLSRVHDGLIVGGFAKIYSAAVASVPWLADIGEKVSLVIVDEAHQVIAPTYSLVVDGLVGRGANKALLGLTATPGRTWADVDQDQKLASFFASAKITLSVPGYNSPVDFLIEEGYLARPTFHSLKHNSTAISDADLRRLSAEFEIPASILAALAEDEMRNLLIVKAIEDLARRHQRILVFSATVSHALVIAAVLCASGIDAKSVTAQTPRTERGETVAWFKEESDAPRVLVNFGVFTAGFDAPRTSAALIARPTKSLVLYSQMVGRATRGVRAGGNAEAEIVTLVDTQLSGFGNMADAFENWEDVWSKP
jgi:superfamily II DNA or RNA helicase